MVKKLFNSVGALLVTLSLTAQPSGADSTRLSVNPTHIKEWADSLIQVGMQEYKVPGAAFVVVTKDSILYIKGYGFANLETSTPVDPYKTHFDMGSIPKALTAVAALQQVEVSKLSLHEPVSKWVPYFTGNAYKTPTLHQLLTHTAGLDDMSNIGSATKSPSLVPSLHDFIQSTPPIQVMPAGEVISYSNLGYGIVGAMIETSSGKQFANYMQEYVLAPLSMGNSSFFAELSEEMEQRRALGYEYLGGEYVAAPINYQINSPAAGLRSTAGDMANFIMMMLNDGKFDGQQVLAGDMVETMKSQQFTNHPDIQGLGYSLRQETINGWNVMAQNGGWQGFNHDFYLIDEAGLGLMVLLNADEGSQVGEAIITSFTEKFLPSRTHELPMVQPTPNLDEYVGAYRSNRYSRKKVTKFGILLGAIPEFEISQASDTLFYFSRPLVYEGNDVFRRVDGVGQIAFLRDDNGKVNTMVRSYSHYDANDKVKVYQTANFQLNLYLVMACFQLILFFISMVLIIRQVIKKQMENGSWIRLSTQLAASILPIVFVLGLMIEFASVGAWDFQYGPTANLQVWLSLMFVQIPLLAFMIYFFIRSRQHFPNVLSKVCYLFSMVLLSGFLMYLNHWNLLGMKF